MERWRKWRRCLLAAFQRPGEGPPKQAIPPVTRGLMLGNHRETGWRGRELRSQGGHREVTDTPHHLPKAQPRPCCCQNRPEGTRTSFLPHQVSVGPWRRHRKRSFEHCHHLSIGHTLQEAACRCLCGFPGKLHTSWERKPRGDCMLRCLCSPEPG